MKTNIIALVLAPPPCPSGLPFLRPRRRHLPHTAHPSPHTRQEHTFVRAEKWPVLVATLTTTGHDANQYWLLAPSRMSSLPHSRTKLYR